MKANRLSAAQRPWSFAGVFLIGLASALGGCVPASSPPAPAPQTPTRPRPVAPTSVTPPPTDWRDAPATAGDWTWTSEAGRSTARFGDGLLTLRCEQPGRLALIRSGGGAGRAALTITTTSLTRTLGVSLAADDPLLDAMAFSRGRFMVTAPGLAPLYVPSWPEIGRVVEDCR